MGVVPVRETAAILMELQRRAFRVVQLTFYLDPHRRDPERLLEDWKTLPAVAAATDGEDFEVIVLQPADEDRRISWNGIDVCFVRERRPFLLRRRRGLWTRPFCWRLVDHIAAMRPDLLHVHSLSFPLHVALLAQRFRDTPILVQDHADSVFPGFRAWLQRFGVAYVNGIAFTAREQAGPFLDAGILRSDHCIFEVLEGSTDFTPNRQQKARRATGLHGDPCFVWLGHLNSNKDPLTVLEAFRRAAPRLRDPKLWFCYRSAPLLAQVRAKIAEHGVLQSSVHLLGARPHEEVEEMLQAADFLLQGSHREGSGYSVIEALACGTTPLVTDIPSFRRITCDGKVGGLFPPGDEASLAEAIIRWSARDGEKMRRAARQHFERHLSYDAIGRDLRDVYRMLLGQSRSSPVRPAGKALRPVNRFPT